MRIVALLAFFCIFSEVALSQTPECRSIPEASDRMASYDRAAPPQAVGKSSSPKMLLHRTNRRHPQLRSTRDRLICSPSRIRNWTRG